MPSKHESMIYDGFSFRDPDGYGIMRTVLILQICIRIGMEMIHAETGGKNCALLQIFQR